MDKETGASPVPPITSFRGEYDFLSNFYPCRIFYQGLWFPSVEHAYQASKTSDPLIREKISKLPTAGNAKAYGKSLKIHPNFELSRLEIMEELIRKKFYILSLRDKLLATGDALLQEVNYWNDRFWGICNGEGSNHLGRILMKIRSELKASQNE